MALHRRRLLLLRRGWILRRHCMVLLGLLLHLLLCLCLLCHLPLLLRLRRQRRRRRLLLSRPLLRLLLFLLRLPLLHRHMLGLLCVLLFPLLLLQEFRRHPARQLSASVSKAALGRSQLLPQCVLRVG